MSKLRYLVCVSAGLVLVATIVARLAAQPTPDSKDAAPEVPLRVFEEQPYDLLRLKDGSEVKVQTMPLKGRRLPDKPRASEKLTVRTLDDPDAEYELAWGDVDLEKTRLFEQLILEEAEQLVATGRFNEAYDYYDHLLLNYPKLDRLEDSLQHYLFEEAVHYQRLGAFDQSLALLNELHRRNPTREDLSQAIGSATGKLVEQRLAADDYLSARKLVKSLQERFPQHPVATAWNDHFKVKARERIAQGQADLGAGKPREAADAARLSLQIWPLEEGRRLLIEAHQKFPRVVVGVCLPGRNREADPMIDWAARRSARLFNRRLLEFTGYGPQGGVYRCPVGEMERLDLGLRMIFRLQPDIPWSDGRGVLTGTDVARRLLRMTDPDHLAFRADWAELFHTVSVNGVYEVDVELRRAHVHPDGLLQTILTPWDESLGDAAGNGRGGSIGPYVIDAATDEEVRYLANRHYFAASDTQPREIVERYYSDQRKALQALRSGQVAMLDRVVPWEVEALRASGDIVVERYAVPTIHCLIPNFKNPLLARRAFRRALMHGMNRTDVLRNQMLRGAPAAFGQVVSGPFPRGEGLEDPVGYAYNDEVEPYPYNQGLAIIRAAMARQELQPMEAGKTPQTDLAASETAGLPEMPKLVLAHPPHDLARVACRAIQKQLQAIRIPIELKELAPEAVLNSSSEWDLLFAELNLWEPVIDARRLLGPLGLTGNCSQYMDLTLRQLAQAEDWKSVRAKLLEVHRQAHDDLAILPLWQLVDHFAYHKSLQGVGKRPAMLYQHIEDWRAPPWFTAEAL